MISYANLGDLGGTPIQLIHVDPLVGAEICWWNMMEMDERHWWNMMKQDETFGIQWRWSSYDPEINLSSPATESVCITAMASGMLWNAIEWLNGFRKGQVLAALVVQTFTQETSRNHCWVVGSCWKPNPWIYQYIAHMCPYNNRYTNLSMFFNMDFRHVQATQPFLLSNISSTELPCHGRHGTAGIAASGSRCGCEGTARVEIEISLAWSGLENMVNRLL